MSRVNLRLILVPICVLLAAVVFGGCGGDGKPEPSISGQGADQLLATLEEVKSNVDVGSCIKAGEVAQELKDEVDALPPTVDDDVTRALQNASDQLLILIEDPDQCDRPEETTTTEETEPTDSTESTQSTQSTQSQPTETQQTQETTTTPPPTTTPPDGGGGIGPPSGGGGGL